jgi:hypothetical protein
MQENIKKQKKLFELEHWKYYLLLEKRFLNSLEYVSLDKDNLACFSMEFSSLLLLIGSELDSVFKIFCGINDEDRSTIVDYANYILVNNSEIVNQVIFLQQYDMSVQPFKDWNIAKPSQSLVWWNAFTNIKHNRSNNLHKASLENVLNMLGALFYIEMLYLKIITKNSNVMDVFGDNSDLFLLKDWTSKAIPLDKVFEYLMTKEQSNATFDAC